MSTTPAADDDFNAAPVMACVPAIVVRPDGFFIPPQAGKATIAFGATPAPGGGAALCVSIQHEDGTILIAAIPDSMLPEVTEAMRDATRQVEERRFAQVGGSQ